jgi:uncharacterized protein YjiK
LNSRPPTKTSYLKPLSAILLICVLLGRVSALSAEPPSRLIYLGSSSVYDKRSGLREPSGLSFDRDTGEFWTVSDDTQHIFRIDRTGKVTARLPKLRGLEDAEGIATTRTGDIVVLSEDGRSLLAMNATPGAGVQTHHFLDMSGADVLLAALDGQPERLSPEGLAIDRTTGAVLVANERDPRLLIELSPSLDAILTVTDLSAEIGFVATSADDHSLDISGLEIDSTRKGLWLSSDTGKAVFFWDRTDKPAQRFDLLWLKEDDIRTVKNAEGVSLSAKDQTLFVITDDGESSRLHAYRIE